MLFPVRTKIFFLIRLIRLRPLLQTIKKILICFQNRPHSIVAQNVFAAEISTGMIPALYARSEDYSLHGSGRYHGRTEVVIEEFIQAAAVMQPRPYTILRLHPKNTREELAPFLDAFDDISQGGPGLDVVRPSCR